MKIKKIILTCLLTLGYLSVSAQNTSEPKTEYIFNRHFYVQLQGGTQYTLGEISFGDLLSPNFQITGGYQINPVVGSRIAINGWWSKGGSKINGEKYKWEWGYLAPSIDATFNISNLFCGYNPTRAFNFGVFTGLGFNIGFSNSGAHNANDAIIKATGVTKPLEYLWDGCKVRPFARAGVTGDFRISDAVIVGFEINANTLNDMYNSKKAKNWDWYFNALAGIKLNIGNTYSVRTISATETEVRYVDRIVEKVVEKIVEVEVPVATPDTTHSPAKTIEPVVEPLRRYIYFALNSSTISTVEAVKVKEIAAYLDQHLEAKVEITGYADAGTGNYSTNERLANLRANAVVKALKEQYGIAAHRISSNTNGSRIQPFENNDDNRVVICIAK